MKEKIITEIAKTLFRKLNHSAKLYENKIHEIELVIEDVLKEGFENGFNTFEEVDKLYDSTEREIGYNEELNSFIQQWKKEL